MAYHAGNPSSMLMLKLALAGIYTLSLLACTATDVDSRTTIQIEGMVIENQTLMYVSAVRLLIPLTGQFVSCGNISPESRCATTFPEAVYKGSPVEITWSQGGQIHSTGQFSMQLPDGLDETKPALVQVVISGPDSAGAMIIQRQR